MPRSASTFRQQPPPQPPPSRPELSITISSTDRTNTTSDWSSSDGGGEHGFTMSPLDIDSESSSSRTKGDSNRQVAFPHEHGTNDPSLLSPSSTTPPAREGGGGHGQGHEETEEGVATTTIFQHLHSIKALQHDIAQTHLALEGVSGQAEQAGGRSRNDWWASLNIGDEASVSSVGKGKDQKDKTAKAYETMADEFSDRQKGVEVIMTKLGELSKALKEFHSLPSPVLFPSLASRMTTDRGANNERTRESSGNSNISGLAALRAETSPPQDTSNFRSGQLRRTGSFA